MKAAIFRAPHTPLSIEEVPEPTYGDRDILIKVAACGLCHSDLHYIDHGTKTFKEPPLALGHEASGVVAAAGSAVTDLKVGDRVLVPPVIPCGTCRTCRARGARRRQAGPGPDRGSARSER